MSKIFMNREVYPSETIKKQEEFLDSLPYERDFKYVRSPDGIFYVSQIKLRGVGNTEQYYFSAGKGLSYEEMLASNYGELIERLSWKNWMDWSYDKDSINAMNLTTGEENLLDIPSVRKNNQSYDYIASGNTLLEAIYHALIESYDYAFWDQPYPLIPFDAFVVDTKNMYPEFPDYIHNNYSILIRRDSRIPLYQTIAFKAPSKNNSKFMPSKVYKKNDRIYTKETVSHTSNAPYDTIDELPWPPFGEFRSGMSLEKTIKITIAEQVQHHYLLKMNGYIDYDIEYSNFDKKEQPYYKYLDANDLENFEENSLEDDVEKILEAFRVNSYNVWAFDITMKGGLPTVKIITDYSIGQDNPFSKRMISKFFNI